MVKYVKAILWLSLIVTSNFASGQVYPVEHYGTREGLAHSEVLNIFQDREGYIWFCTSGGGVSRYDGEVFETFDRNHGLKNNIIRGITQDQEGYIWVGSLGGGLYKLVHNRFEEFSDSNLNKNIYALHCDRKGTIWVATEAGLYCIKNEKIFNFSETMGLKLNQVSFVNGDGLGNIWFNNLDGVYRYDFDTLIAYKNLPTPSLFFYHSSDDTTWIGTSGGLFKIGTQEKDAQPEKVKLEEIPDYYVFECTEDKFGNLMIGTQTKGIIRWNRKTGEVEVINYKSGMQSNTVFRMITDRDDNVWASVYGEGVARFHDARFIQYSDADGLKNRLVTSIGNGTLYNYAGTSDGLFRSSGNEWKRMFEDKGVHRVSTIQKDQQGKVWFAGNSTAGYFIEKKGKTEPVFLDWKQEPPFQEITDIAIKSNGQVYIASWGTGLWAYTPGEGLSPVEETRQYGVSSIYDLFIDSKGVLWIGTWDSGLLKLNDGKLEAIDQKDGLETNKVRCIAEHGNGDIFIGTSDGGVSLIRNGKVVKTILKKDGLVHNTIVSLVINDGFLWCGASNGLTRISLEDFSTKNYDYHDGLKGECSNTALSFNKEGHLFIGTDQYLFVYHEKEDTTYSFSPGVALHDIELHYGESDIEDYSKEMDGLTNLPHDLVLPYFENTITFDYNGIGVNMHDKMEFRHKLEGLEDEYSPLRKTREITYSDLSPGAYTFYVKSCVGDNCCEPIRFSFIINKPLWMEWWFILLETILVILTLFGLLRLRTRQLRASKAKLERTVSNRTYELQQQKKLVEQKNEEILDSINYAKRIQAAILPSDRRVSKHLPDSFVLYIPKDIVAGDFYWLESVQNRLFFAVADCTGHGVPGAMVSVVCNNALNRAIKEFGLFDPGKILDKAREIVVEEFEKSEENVQDGMDIALCMKSENEFWFSGANNPVWIVSKGELKEIKGTKQPVGIFANPKPFQSHKLDVKSGDTLFLFSDGYADQFGGEKGKKFMKKRLKKLLVSLASKGMSQQKEELEQIFYDWKGTREQVDDICVIGVKVS